jgi:hypothetical protein
MSEFRVSPEDLGHLAASVHALSTDLDAFTRTGAIDGGGGTPDVDAGVFDFGAFTGSHARHLMNDLGDLAARLERAQQVYSEADQAAAAASSASAGVLGGGGGAGW